MEKYISSTLCFVADGTLKAEGARKDSKEAEGDRRGHRKALAVFAGCM